MRGNSSKRIVGGYDLPLLIEHERGTTGGKE